MKKLLVRALSGIVYIGVILGCYFLGHISFFILAVLMAVCAIVEFTRIYGELRGDGWAYLVMDALGVLALMSHFAFGLPLSVWVICLLVRFVAQLYDRNDEPVRRLSVSIFKQVYVGIGLGTMVSLSHQGNMVLAVFFLIWINDTFAFIVGSLTGRHKMSSVLSPKKSWEGFIGGLLFTLGASAWFGSCLKGFFAMDANIWIWLAIGLLTVAMSTWGDLLESMIKRSLHIKDAGNIIPGHGGILDRIDSLLLAMPAVWLLLQII